jgi:hypothetical protein
VVLINSSLLTIPLYYAVRKHSLITTQNISPFHDLITEFYCIARTVKVNLNLCTKKRGQEYFPVTFLTVV